MGRTTRQLRGVVAGLLLACRPIGFAHDRVPVLPFADNPDPTQCGIPQPMAAGTFGVLHGRYQDRVVEPEVHLVDSHLRREVVGHVPAGERVAVLAYQDDPELNFYLVRFVDADGPVEGWVPAPYLRLSDPR